MSTGIGKNCELCGNQLTFDVGFNHEETLCKKCEEIKRKLLAKLLDSKD